MQIVETAEHFQAAAFSTSSVKRSPNRPGRLGFLSGRGLGVGHGGGGKACRSRSEAGRIGRRRRPRFRAEHRARIRGLDPSGINRFRARRRVRLPVWAGARGRETACRAVLDAMRRVGPASVVPGSVKRRGVAVPIRCSLSCSARRMVRTAQLRCPCGEASPHPGSGWASRGTVVVSPFGLDVLGCELYGRAHRRPGRGQAPEVPHRRLHEAAADERGPPSLVSSA